MTKRKESKLGHPPWFIQAGAVQQMIIDNPEKGIAAHVADYAAQEQLSPRMLKRFMQLKTFLEENYSEQIVKFMDRTPASVIDELEKIHAIDNHKADELVEACVGGQIIAASLKEILKKLTSERKVPETINQRSESRQLTIALENAVKQELKNNPSRFGISKTHEIRFQDELLIKPDLAVYESSISRYTAIEVKYFSPNSVESVFQHTLCKLNWLCRNKYDNVILCTQASSELQLEKWLSFYKNWTGQSTTVLYF